MSGEISKKKMLKEEFTNFLNTELIDYYKEVYIKYLKMELAFNEVKKIMNMYGFVLNHYEELDILKKKYIEIKGVLNLKEIKIPEIDMDVTIDIEDIVDIITKIYDKKIDWIKEHSYYYDSEYYGEYLGIDNDYCLQKSGEEVLPSSLVVAKKRKLCNRMIEKTREIYEGK